MMNSNYEFFIQLMLGDKNSTALLDNESLLTDDEESFINQVYLDQSVMEHVKKYQQETIFNPIPETRGSKLTARKITANRRKLALEAIVNACNKYKPDGGGINVLIAIIKKIYEAHAWYIESVHESINSDNEYILFVIMNEYHNMCTARMNKFEISEKEESLKSPIKLKKLKEYFKLPDTSLFINRNMRYAAETLYEIAICDCFDRKEDYLLMKSSNITDILSSIERVALKNTTNAKIEKEEYRVVKTKANMDVKEKGVKAKKPAIRREQMELLIKEEAYNEMSLISPETDKLFRVMNELIMQNHYKYDLYSFSLDEYMDLTGMKDRKHAIETVDKALLGLNGMGVRVPGFYTNFFTTTKLERTAGSDNVTIKVLVGKTFLEELSKITSLIKYPKKLFKIPSNKRTEYYIARLALLHHRRNIGHDNAYTLLMQTIVDHLPNLQTVDELRWKSDSKQFVIQPILDAFKYLDDEGICKCTISGGGVDVLTEADLMKWDIFIKTKVVFDWYDEPNYDNLLELKTAHAEEKKMPKPAKIVWPQIPPKKRGRPPKKKPEELT